MERCTHTHAPTHAHTEREREKEREEEREEEGGRERDGQNKIFKQAKTIQEIFHTTSAL